MSTRRRRRTVSVKRGDAAEVLGHETSETETRDGQLLDLQEPQFLSIVKAPANRTPFKVVRDDGGTRRRRRQTADAKALLTVTLPEDVTMERAEEIFDKFGLNRDEYEITTGEDGRISYRRNNTTGDEETVSINMGNGVVAQIRAESLTRGMPVAEDHPGITVLRFDFETRDAGIGWLKDHEIDAEGIWLELEESVTFCRHDVMPPEDAIEFEVDGVSVTVAQTREDDVPVRIYRQVIEEAYGSHGYGMINFNQAMADIEFTRDAREANYLLWDILDNILFYSYLPLADRQALVMNALNQFAVWLSNLMSALPRAMTEPDATVDLNSQGTSDDNAARSENDPSEETKETADMSKGKEQQAQGAEDQENVERQDASDESSEENTATETETVERTETETETEVEDTEKVFTRSEAQAIAETAVEAHMEKLEQKKREDEGPATASSIGAAVAAAMGEALAPVVQRVDDLAKKVDQVKSTTIAREDTEDDDSTHNSSESDEDIKRKDPYRGAIFGDGLYQREAG